MNLLETLISGIIALWLGSVEYRMRKLREDTNSNISRSDVSELIDLKNEASQVRHAELKEDIKEMKEKINKLIDLQMSNK